MKIVLTGHPLHIAELTEGISGVEWIKAESVHDFVKYKDASAFFNLNNNASEQDYSSLIAPVFINSVIVPLRQIKNSENLIRVNGWKGFIKRSTWEIAGLRSPAVEMIMKTLGKKFIYVADEPGFISARILSMIVNEAYFAKEENVSTERDIDTAMKLGTNYPKGPFEWAEEIGKVHIFYLLTALTDIDKRYTPAPLLQTEAYS